MLLVLLALAPAILQGHDLLDFCQLCDAAMQQKQQMQQGHLNVQVTYQIASCR